jgi:hypothetical protein
VGQRRASKTQADRNTSVVTNASPQITIMITDVLFLRRNHYTTLDYNELKIQLKRRTSHNFKLGFIDNEEISLYYLRDWYTENGMDRVPFCRVEVKNKIDADGRIRIRFRIATFALIAAAFFPIALMFIFFFTNPSIPFYYLLGLYPVMYFFLQIALADQGEKFELDLRKIEMDVNK